jgi:hypothetical protein
MFTVHPVALLLIPHLLHYCKGEKMKLVTLHRFGGISLILGSLLLATYAICFSLLLPVKSVRQDYVAAVMNPNWIWITSVAFFGVVFMIFGFTAVYSRISEGSGALGLWGYIVLEKMLIFLK